MGTAFLDSDSAPGRCWDERDPCQTECGFTRTLHEMGLTFKIES